MNDFTKERIALKLRNALDTEKISQVHATEILGLKSFAYISSMLSHRPEHWVKTSKKSWEQVRKWVNSGESLKNYSLLTEKEKEKFMEEKSAPQDEQLCMNDNVVLNRAVIKETVPEKEKRITTKASSTDPLDAFLNNMKKLGYKVEVKIYN